MSARGHTAPLAGQAECPPSAEVRPWRGRRERFGACWPRLRVQRRAHRATAARDEHWRVNGGVRSFPNRRSAGDCIVATILRASDPDRHGTVNRVRITYGRSTGTVLVKTLVLRNAENCRRYDCLP